MLRANLPLHKRPPTPPQLQATREAHPPKIMLLRRKNKRSPGGSTPPGHLCAGRMRPIRQSWAGWRSVPGRTPGRSPLRRTKWSRERGIPGGLRTAGCEAGAALTRPAAALPMGTVRVLTLIRGSAGETAQYSGCAAAAGSSEVSTWRLLAGTGEGRVVSWRGVKKGS